MVSKRNTKVLYRDFWGTSKREALVDSLDADDFEDRYETASPNTANRFSLRPGTTVAAYSTWASLPDLSALAPFSGVLEKRRGSLFAFDRGELAERMRRYFDPRTSIDDLRAAGIGPVADMARFVASKARTRLLHEEAFSEHAIRRVALHPFEDRWAYHTNVRPIWNEPRPELVSRAFRGNSFVVTRFRARRPEEGLPIFCTPLLPGDHLLDPNAHPLPVFASRDEANLSSAARAWLAALGLPDADADRNIAELPWRHVLAIGYARQWLSENGDEICQDWPRVPLPDNADLLRTSATLGARVAALLDPDMQVPGVTAGTILPALATIASPTKRGGGAMTEADRDLTAGWGHAGKDGAVMPGRGRITTRDYTTSAEAQAYADLLGARTCDVWLNHDAFWRNIPEAVWSFMIGGYQVLKKWLSYREKPLVGRALSPAEVRYVRDVARRLAALRLMAPELDANYRACAAAHRPLS